MRGVQLEPIACKSLKPGSSGKAKADFLLEASIMGQFMHRNVVRLIGVVTKQEPVCSTFIIIIINLFLLIY